MQRYNILWADDEIDLLKPHILFLEKKGYDVTPVNSGADAIEQVEQGQFDVVFLDENMPGMTGLETLAHIKTTRPSLPVVMITKSEEEHIMEEAIGAKIADYLIKPLNPNQILLSVKKILDKSRLVTERTNMGYQQAFMHLSMAFGDIDTPEEWIETYKKLVYWELEIDTTEDKSMYEVLVNQKEEANNYFTRFISNNYEYWLNEPHEENPLLSHQLLEQKVLPLVNDQRPVYLLVIDNLRYDQWKTIEPVVLEMFNMVADEAYYSILPTTTAYARNAIFSGLMPLDMQKKHPDLWVGEKEDEGKNNHEHDFLKAHLKRKRLDLKTSYHKVKNVQDGKQLAEQVRNLKDNHLNAIVYNFVDMLSHARTDLEMIRELAPDESAYRSITRSWLMHSPLMETLRQIAAQGGHLVLTTDHGTIRVKKPYKIVGDRNVNTNLRYKQGKNLGFDESGVYTCRKPERLKLPRVNVSTAYVFATQDHFFAYPNNFNYYVNYYKDTFQHGGVSLEEVIIPIISLSSKNVDA